MKPKSKTSPDPQIQKARTRASAHYWANREKKLLYAASYRKANKLKIATSLREWAAANKSHLTAYKKRYGKEKKGVIMAYRKRHEKKVASYQANYVRANREKINQQRVEYYQTPSGREIVTNSAHRRRAAKANCERPATAAQIRRLREASRECYYCRGEGLPLTLDHVMPLARGGAHSITNLVMACGPCNCRKKDRDPYEFMRSYGLF